MDPPDEPLKLSPPICRQCGEPMEQGFIEGEAARAPATIMWIGNTVDESGELATLPIFRFSASPRFPANRCEDCGVLEVASK